MHALFFYSLLTTLLLAFTTQALFHLTRTTGKPIYAFYARSVLSFTALILCAFYGTLVSALLSPLGYGGLGQYLTARAFKWSMWVLVGVWFEMIDEDGILERVGNGETSVLLGNHQTELDVLALGHIFPKWCSVTAKASLKWWPFLGWFMSLSKTVFIERTSRTQSLAAFSIAAQQMHAKPHPQSVFLFPEGTRSYFTHPDLLPFKKGAFHLAVQAQVPIVPIVVANYSDVLDMKKRVFRAGTVQIKVLRPVSTKGKAKEDVDALLEEIRGKMLGEIRGLRAQAVVEDGGKANGLRESTDVKGRSSGVEVGYNAAA